MTNYQIKKSTLVTAVSALVLLSMQSMTVVAHSPDENGYPREKVIRSIVATGLNDVLGERPFDLGPPFGAFGFAMLGIYNPSGPEPVPLSPKASDSDLLTTVAHPNFLSLAGKTRADVQPGWENVPLRDVPINIDFASIATHGNGIKKPLRGVLAAEPLEVAQAEPANPITVGQWMKGRGILKIACESKDRATLKMTVKSLLPNRIYGIGATMGRIHTVPVNEGRLSPFTIGGVPHIFATDEQGDGEIERTINFCPLDPESMERPLLVVNLLHYSRHQNYGAVPEPVFVNGLWLGMVTHNHLQFPVNVKTRPISTKTRW